MTITVAAVAAASPATQANSGGRFIPLMLEHMQRIVADSYARIQDYQSGTHPADGLNSLLGKGVWYANDYYQALKKYNQTKRLQFFVQKGHFFHGYAPPELFEQQPDTSSPTGKRLYSFKIKQGIPPSEALSKLNDTFILLDCSSTRQLAAYLALRDLMKKETFDHLFSADSPYALCLGTDSLSPLFKKVRIHDEAELQVGDFVHYCSIREYVPKHPAGSSRGFNVILGPEKCHLGLGLDPKGLTGLEIEGTLWKDYNADPLDEAALPPSVWHYFYTKCLARNEEISKREVAMRRDRKISWEAFRAEPARIVATGGEANGKLELTILRPDLERIERLVQAPLDEVRAVFA